MYVLKPLELSVLCTIMVQRTELLKTSSTKMQIRNYLLERKTLGKPEHELDHTTNN